MKRFFYFILWMLCFLFGIQPQNVQSEELIPYPDSLIKRKGTFSTALLKTMQFPAEWKDEADLFMADINKRTGLILHPTKCHSVLVVRKNLSLPAEAYSLTVRKEQILIEAAESRGMNYALTTLQQLILSHSDGMLPLLTIRDCPRFSYRGVMLDCSRHFWTLTDLKKTIEQMAFFKLNVLHLHLTDNQAWRLAMDKYPELAVKGTFYEDFPALSYKYYRKSELKELVSYAAVRGVEIVPEVDLPGHCLALLAGFPELSCNGGKFEAYPEEQEFEKRKRTTENMLCIGNPSTLTFAEDVINALIEIFPSPYIHLGGDEVNTGIWEQCAKCMDLYHKKGMKDLHELQDYFTKELSKMVRSKGKIMIGWDEINARSAASPEDMLTIWQKDGKEQQIKALKRGVPVIMCPKDPCYFDFGYARNPTRKVYEWNPIDERIPDWQHHLVKGGQACLWTEFVTTQDCVERLYYPRLCALAEVLWDRSSRKDWDDFRHRLHSFSSQLKKLDINYYKGDTLNRQWFDAENSYPELYLPARIETNIQSIKFYGPEYAFDGRYDTFFSSSFAVGRDNYFSIVLDYPVKIKGIKVLCDDSKDFLSSADLLVSEDGNAFRRVAAFDKQGQLETTLDDCLVKIIKIQVTDKHFCRLTIREIMLDISEN